MTKIAIVGSSGPLGALITGRLRLLGYEVEEFSRRGENFFDVTELSHYERFRKFNSIVYLAWDSSDRSLKNQMVHANAAIKFSKECIKYSVRTVFVSSTLAGADALSTYGKAKYVAENGVLENEGVVLRVGLVCDDAFPLLSSRMRQSGIIKFISKSNIPIGLFPVSGNQVTHYLDIALSNSPPRTRYWLADKSRVSLKRIVLYPSGDFETRRFSFSNQITKSLNSFAKVFPSVDRISGIVGGPIEVPSDCQTFSEHLQIDSWAENFARSET